jgi:hypothetical protein
LTHQIPSCNMQNQASPLLPSYLAKQWGCLILHITTWDLVCQ